MEWKFYSRKMYMGSPMYYEHLKNKPCLLDEDWPFVNMAGSVRFKTLKDHDENNVIQPTLFMQVDNETWEDTFLEDDGSYAEESISFNIEFTREQVIYLKNYLEAFLESNPTSTPL